MKKKTYNILLVAFYVCGALLISSGLFRLGMDYQIRMLEGPLLVRMHITLLVTAILVLLAHYCALLWGLKRNLLKKTSVTCFCVVDVWLFGFFALSVVIGFINGAEKFVELLTNPNIDPVDICDLIFRTISLMIPSLRVAFTAYILNAKKANDKERL